MQSAMAAVAVVPHAMLGTGMRYAEISARQFKVAKGTCQSQVKGPQILVLGIGE